jgi:arylsulfatase A-like enzyme
MAPGAAPRVLPGPVSIIDVAPTLLDIFGVPVPKDYRGRSLAPVLWGNAGTPAARPILIDMPKGPTNPFIRALIQSDADGDWKLIYWADRKVYQLFNLRDDPKELQNLTRKEKERFAALKVELERWFTKELRIKRARGAEDEDETEP